MNKERRKELKKALDLLLEARLIIEGAQEEEEECYDNLPDGIINSDRGEELRENYETLEEIAYEVSEQEDALQEVIG